MSKVLCTFSGKFGDILWSLPTVRELSRRHEEPVDFAIMPQYKSLLDLLGLQPYIASARVIPNWECTGSPCGDQPWQPPHECEEGYEHVYHLTYRQHPGMGGAPALPLCDFTAWQQGIKLRTPVVPFITAESIDIFPPPPQPVIPVGFNGDYWDMTTQFRFRLTAATASLLSWIDISALPWMQAASLISQMGIFVGCRSALWVLAMGLGARTIVYEPNPSRHAEGHWGRVFGCPYGKEEALSLHQTPHQAGDDAAQRFVDWRDQYWSRERRGEKVLG